MTLAQRKRLLPTPAILIAVAAGAFVAGRWIPRGDRQASTASRVLPPQPAGRVAPAVSQSEGAVARQLDPVQREAIRRLLREEVDAALAERDAARAAEQAAPATEPAPESPAGAAAAAGARERVEAARRSRRWTREDAAALRSAIGKMSASERDEILSTLVPAVNRGEIQPDYAGFLF